ncbi:MAG: 1-acyl-sn-glycerol-3-phosphate acyltransferase [Bacteroidales bacterium]|nr:1-acyl-sn-glycerol-3-phosphate acyltransferase [Candidatus Colimorpha onthohippi]
MLYSLLRPLVDFAVRCHYGSLTVNGLDNLPKKGGYIIAPCHQNAMMDPILMLQLTKRGIWFLCRGDIFANPYARKALTFLKIMPVYRIRDGRKALSQDSIIFDRSRQLLLSGSPLCLMPEGRHTDRHQLLPLGKGLSRIAIATQRDLGKDIPLYIVPVGLDYDYYERTYSNVIINVGAPLDTREFMPHDMSDDDCPKSLVAIRESLSEAMKRQMYHVPSLLYYAEQHAWCMSHIEQERERMCLPDSPWGRFQARKSLAEKLQPDDLTDGMRAAVEQYDATERSNYRWLLIVVVVLGLVAGGVLRSGVRNVLLFLIVSYPIPWIPTHRWVRKKIADPQFRSSINFGLRFGISLIYVLLFSVVMFVVCGWQWGIAAIVSSLLQARLVGPVMQIIRR